MNSRENSTVEIRTRPRKRNQMELRILFSCGNIMKSTNVGWFINLAVDGGKTSVKDQTC